MAGPTSTTLVVRDEHAYAIEARAELAAWRRRTMKEPGALDRAARGLQGRINRIIPEPVHAAVTAVMERMTRAILTGADFTALDPLVGAPLSEREAQVRGRIAAYRAAGAAEGGIAGAGGFALAAAEFPTLLTTKMKLLFDIAALYGHDGGRIPERLYILSVFQLAFSGADRRRDVLAKMADWDARAGEHPEDLDGFEWRRFQQEYRDYIDLAKLAQLLPVIGAPVGAVVNYRLLDRLGETAIKAYRMRWFGS